MADNIYSLNSLFNDHRTILENHGVRIAIVEKQQDALAKKIDRLLIGILLTFTSTFAHLIVYVVTKK